MAAFVETYLCIACALVGSQETMDITWERWVTDSAGIQA